jgi:hypothetical protein
MLSSLAWDGACQTSQSEGGAIRHRPEVEVLISV